MSELTTYDPAAAHDDAPQTWRPSAALDPARYEFLWAFSGNLAKSSVVPDSLKMAGKKGDRRPLSDGAITANVFIVVEQADRWNIAPTALLSCAAIVHGKLGFEGKVIAAVLEANHGIELTYEITGTGEDMEIIVGAVDKRTGAIICDASTGRPKVINGSVKKWKTTGDGSPWSVANYERQLRYRGGRDWARAFKATAILGINSIDELLDFAMEDRAQHATDVTPPSLKDRLGGGRAGATGFDANAIAGQLADTRGVQMDMVKNDDREKVAVERTAEAHPAPQAASAQTAGLAPPTSDPAVDRIADLSAELDDDLGEATTAEAVEAKVAQFKIDHSDMTAAEKKALVPIKTRHLERVAPAPAVADAKTAAADTKAPAADPDGLDDDVPGESLETEG